MAEQKTTTKINEAIDALGRYYNVRSKSAFLDLLIDLEESKPVSENTDLAARLEAAQDKPPEHKIGELFLQATEGSLTTMGLLGILETDLAGEHAQKIAELISITFEPDAITAKSCGAVARPIPIKLDDESKAGHAGGSYFADPDFLGAEVDSNAEVVNDVVVGPYTPSIRNLFWSEEMTAAMLEKDGEDALAKYNLDSWNSERDHADKGLNVNHADWLDEAGPKHPIVSCFDIKDSHLTPANRDSGAVAVFMNFIPTLEMSRCQPYLDIQIISQKPPVAERAAGTEFIDTLSLSQFLMGNVDVSEKKDTADHIITTAANASILASGMYRNDPDTEDKDESKIATAGMEIFTSPQLMVDADNTDFATPESVSNTGTATEAGGTESHRAAKIIDKFRPLATLKDFSVEVTPSGGMMSHKTAKLSLTLHDRSRLAEMGEFIKPDLYGSVELLIEYGWMHPDGLHLAADDTDNPFATMLNSMRVTEKYKIVNSDFSFDEVGQVEIGVSLSMVGLLSFDTSDISKGPGVKDALKEVNDLFDIIRTIRRRMQPPADANSTDVTGETWLNSMTSMSGHAGLDAETLAAMNAWRTTHARRGAHEEGSNADELTEALNNLLGEGGEDGALATLGATIDSALGWKKEHLKSSHSGDPWWRPVLPDNNSDNKQYCKVRFSCCDPRIDTHLSRDDQNSNGRPLPQAMKSWPKFVSLGKLLMTYVAGPLAMDAKFDEIQWFFYPFNNNASFMHNRQVSEFPINVAKFEAELDKMTEKNAYIPLRRFLGMLQRKFVGNIDNEAYGLSDLYKDDPEEEGNRILVAAYTGGELTALHDAKNERLAYAYTRDHKNPTKGLKFKKPRLAIHTECVPSMNTSEAGVSSKMKTILKIHVYDKACSSYSGCQDLLTAARNSSMGQISDNVRELSGMETTKTVDQRYADIIEKAIASKILEKVGSASPPQFRVIGGFPKIKQFIRSVMPSIIYGSSTSAVLSAGLTSNNDPQMATIHMMRSGHGDARSPSGTRSAGLPLKVVPTTLDLEVIGCPLVSFGQQFFVDFQTGTNVDNVYAVTGISHTLMPGEFKTSIKMTQLDAYGAYESTLNVVAQAVAAITPDPPPE